MQQTEQTPGRTNAAASKPKSTRLALLSAIFLMATSAIGPGFITQTATFTTQLGAAFAFGILASILIDFVVQLNIWRIVTLTRMRARTLPMPPFPAPAIFLQSSSSSAAFSSISATLAAPALA